MTNVSKSCWFFILVMCSCGEELRKEDTTLKNVSEYTWASEHLLNGNRIDNRLWFFKHGTIYPEQKTDDTLFSVDKPGDRILEQLMYIPSNYSSNPNDSILINLAYIMWWDIDSLSYKLFDKCPVNNCRITKWAEYSPRSDVIVIDGSKMPQESERTPEKLWIFHSMEGPYNANYLCEAKDINWTMTYRIHSDVVIPYARWIYYDPNGVMCLGCDRAWTVLHVLWSAIYVICGAAQLIAGIFFFISIPSIHLSSNLWAGTWNIVIGIGVGMLACFARVSSRRQEFLLYMAASILIVNAVNAVMTEWAYYVTDMKEVLGSHRYVVLIQYACLATRLAASVVILTSFLDTQFAFCSMQSVPKRSTGHKKKRRGCGTNTQEQVSDIEYIIPRRKNSKPQTTILNAYSQSWVYDADVIAPPNNHAEPTSYLKIPQEVAPIVTRREENSQDHSDTTHLIDNPVVHIEEASDDSNSNSDRKLCYMKSFSRATSPAVLSPSSSQVSLNNPPIYECLQKVIEPETYRSRLNSALSDKSEKFNKLEKQYQAPQVMRSPKVEKVEKVQYASLMKELQKAIVSKKETTSSSSPPSSSSDKTQSSKSKNSDAEFSKELEAALQLIQDLESPNTIETPSSEPGPVWRNDDEDEKTLSAADSPISDHQAVLPELTSFKPIHGKTACVLIRNSESQSTSGYSSPTHKTPDWSTTSSVNSDHGKHNLTYTIHNTKSSAVISLYADETTPKAKNVTLVSISGDDIESCPHSTVLYNETLGPLEEVKLDRSSSNGTNLWNVKSLLRKKKGYPKMCAELEGAIIKSESLAYLSENELLERHQRSKDIQRQIEQRVLQQLGTPRSESQC